MLNFSVYFCLLGDLWLIIGFSYNQMFLFLHSIRVLQPPASYISVIAPEEWRLQRSRSNLWGFGFHFAEVEMELQPFPLANLTQSSCTRYLGEHPQKNLWADPSPGRCSTVAWPMHLVEPEGAWASAAIYWGKVQKAAQIPHKESICWFLFFLMIHKVYF